MMVVLLLLLLPSGDGGVKIQLLNKKLFPFGSFTHDAHARMLIQLKSAKFNFSLVFSLDCLIFVGEIICTL